MCVCGLYIKCNAPVCISLCIFFISSSVGVLCLGVFVLCILCIIWTFAVLRLVPCRLYFLFLHRCFVSCCAVFCTFAALWLVTHSVMRWLAALTAFSLHIDFAATLSGNQTQSNVSHPVTDSSVQGAQRVAVTGYRHTTGLRVQV